MKVNNKYIKYLKGGFFKCLCLFEEKNEGLSAYIKSFNYELYGLYYLLEDENDTIITLLSILKHLYENSFEFEPDLKLIRSEVFHCINLVDKIFKVGDID